MSTAAHGPKQRNGISETVEVICFTLFFSFLRIQIRLPEVGSLDAAEIYLAFGRGRSATKWTQQPYAGGTELIVECLVQRDGILTGSDLVIVRGDETWRMALSELSALAARTEARSLAGAFKDAIIGRAAELAPLRPRLLDVGGRARSGVERRLEYPECDVTVADIHKDGSVDVVCDAHELSLHFVEETFDFALCVSVFEHLLMPWKVAIELNRVLKVGARALIHTHQTIGMHDIPWDFFRFSDTSWAGLFNRFTGFEIVSTAMSHFMHIVPRSWTESYSHAEHSGGFEGSSVLVRKTGRTRLEWNVPLFEIVKSGYPLHPDGNRR